MRRTSVIKVDALSLVLIAGGAACLVAPTATAQLQGARPPRVAATRINPVASGVGNGNPTDDPDWSDNFDSYANGSQLIGQGGMVAWPGYPTSNPTGFASNTFAASAPNSCRLALASPGAVPPTDQSDFIRPLAITGGHWICRAKTYMPSSAVATGAQPAPYFMLLNSYPAFSWSVQVHFEKNLGRILADRVGGPAGVGGGVSDPPIALILDQWVELVVDIDLDASPNGAYSVTYGGTPVITGADWKVGSAPPRTLQALNLYDSNTSAFYVDDASVEPATGPAVCYPNCDHSTTAPCLNVLDFACFLNSFAAGQTYANCDNSTIAPVLNVLDFACFLNSFATGCSNC